MKNPKFFEALFCRGENETLCEKRKIYRKDLLSAMIRAFRKAARSLHADRLVVLLKTWKKGGKRICLRLVRGKLVAAIEHFRRSGGQLIIQQIRTLPLRA